MWLFRRPLFGTPPRCGDGAEGEVTKPSDLQMPHLDVDTAIRLRWALRDIKGRRTRLSPVTPDDLAKLIELGLVEMQDDAPMITAEGDRALDWS